MLSEISSERRLLVDRAARLVHFDGRTVELSRREFAILEALIETGTLPVSKTSLRRRVYGEAEPRLLGNPIEVHIHNVREKLGPDLIRNVRKVGYLLDAVVDLIPPPVDPDAPTPRPSTAGTPSLPSR